MTGCTVDKSSVLSVSSPNRAYNLSVEAWDVGATSGISYHVDLTKYGFLAGETQEEVAIFDKVFYEGDIQIKWTSATEVTIFAPGARVFKHLKTVTFGQHQIRLILKT